MRHRLLFLLLFHLIFDVQFAVSLRAQGFQFSFHLGQYNHQYYLNGEFNDIITETSNSSNNLEFIVGLSLRKEILNSLELQLDIHNYSTFAEGMLFYDTTEDQIFGSYVRKGHTFGARTYSPSIKTAYQIDLVNDVKLILGAGIEYFLLINRDPIGNINLGRQHPRLNDFLTRIDEAFFRNRLLPLFSVGL